MKPATYEYEPIPPGEHFRYLVLQPGTGKEPLLCSLVTTLLNGTQYEAISYVWGCPDRKRTIWCEGRPLKITSSLCRVLRRLRYPDAPRQIWADGICINQDDMKEKGHQVGFMSKIYRKAHRVLLYVGSDCGEDGERVSTLLRDVRRSIDDELTRLDTSTFDVYPYPAPGDSLVLDPRWTAMGHLIRKEWFKRGWVVREAALAQSCLFIWGQSQYDWDEFMLVWMWVVYRANNVVLENEADEAYIIPHIFTYCDRHIASVRPFFAEEQAYPTRLLDYVCYDLQFTDPRDRVYAFLDLTTEHLNGLVLRPDYGLPIEKVFHDFAEQYIRATGDTKLLDYVVHATKTLQSELPSWVPGWDLVQPEYSQAITLNKAGPAKLYPEEETFRRPEVVDKTTLKLHGIVFDSVRFLSEVLLASTTTPEVVAKLWNFVRHTEGPSPYLNTQRLEAFFNTITKNQHWGDLRTWRLFAATYMQRLYEHTGDPSSFGWDIGDQQAERLTYVHGMVKLHTGRLRYMITERGYMGLAPAVAREGDACSIIFGCAHPSLLRVMEDKSRYQFLGGTYVLGSLHAEFSDVEESVPDDEGWEGNALHDLNTGINAMKLSGKDDDEDISYKFNVWNEFGDDNDKAWVKWAEEQDIYLC